MSARISIHGNLGKDPELKETKSGKKMAKFSVAVNRRAKVGDSYENVTDWFNITCWDKHAELVNNHFWKGKEIILHGTLQNNNYEKDGQKVYQDAISVRDIEFCGSKGEDPRKQESSSSESSGGGEELPF
jgi:single-strand DNA-binding protein